jgi:hypothetical protein
MNGNGNYCIHPWMILGPFGKRFPINRIQYSYHGCHTHIHQTNWTGLINISWNRRKEKNRNSIQNNSNINMYLLHILTKMQRPLLILNLCLRFFGCIHEGEMHHGSLFGVMVVTRFSTSTTYNTLTNVFQLKRLQQNLM